MCVNLCAWRLSQTKVAWAGEIGLILIVLLAFFLYCYRERLEHAF